MRCPHCKDRVVYQKGRGYTVRIDGAVTIDEDDRATAKCFWCKKPIAIPLKLELPERLVIDVA